MSSPQASVIPQSFSPLERFLVEKTEEAIRDGVQVERWCRDPRKQIKETLLDLRKVYTLTNQAYGYLSTLPMNGKQEAVMGVRQVVDFSKVIGPHPEEQLRDYVLGEFLPRAHWVYPDGYPGGFTIEQSIY